jgi:sugar phosphate isomerase/epimerase
MGVFDIKQARRSGYPWQMYVKDMAGSIAYAHLSDIDADGRMCLPGFGIYDFNEILKRLQDVGFDGNLLIEVYGSDYKDKADLTRSLEFLREAVDKIV